jgi:ligand-binding SRPBCC domain-containing protein
VENGMQPIRLEFHSRLAASTDEVWKWITSWKNISMEMRPYFRMTAPKGVTSIEDVNIVPGQPLFRSRVYLFGIIPIDYSDVTLVELDTGRGFVEQSPMGSMRLWRHERRISNGAHGCTLTDVLTFQPRRARRIVAWFIGRVFMHRHAVLKRYLG